MIYKHLTREALEEIFNNAFHGKPEVEHRRVKIYAIGEEYLKVFDDAMKKAAEEHIQEYENQRVMNRQILIKQVSRGKYKGQFRFAIRADNYLTLASSEAYANLTDITEMAEKYFPDFQVHLRLAKKDESTPA